MQITFDPENPTDVDLVMRYVGLKPSPAPAPPVHSQPLGTPHAPGLPTSSPAPQAAPAPPQAAPAPPPVTDDPMPNPANLRTAGEVSDGQLTPESFRQRIAAVGQRVGMPKLRAFIESKGFNKLDQIPAANFIDLVTGAEAIA